MQIKNLNLEKFILAGKTPVIDVRSESEFAQGHFPGAINKPLLNDAERKLVGICHKKKGNIEAVHLGYELIGSKFSDKLRAVRKSVNSKDVYVYCWRGGLRSKIFTQLLDNGGFNASRLEGGYKAFRTWALSQFDISYPLITLGGPTGVGKTDILLALKAKGEQVLNLEGIAGHKGSTYGGIGMPQQRTNEQFENDLAMLVSRFSLNKPIWVESESRMLGKIKINDAFFKQMSASSIITIELPLAYRIQRILQEYAVLPKEDLIKATAKLEKRLGNLTMNHAIAHIEAGDFEDWIKIMLIYYDKSYLHGRTERPANKCSMIELPNNDTKQNTDLIYSHYYERIAGI